METTATNAITRNNRTIALNYFQEIYNAIVNDKTAFRKHLDEMIALYPELFPDDIADGYTLKEIRYSKKQNVWIRRIEVNNVSYTIRPSFIMPCMTGKTDEIEKALFLRKFDVPFWALSYVFGKDHMYWYRIEQSLGRNSIVGTTIRNPDDIPRNLGAEEKHSWILSNKIYVATTGRLHEWCKKNNVPDVIMNPIAKLRKHLDDYSIAYDHHEEHRTSNC